MQIVCVCVKDELDSAPFNNTAMLQAADVLSAIASTSVGRRHLLYGEGGQSLAKKRSEVM